MSVTALGAVFHWSLIVFMRGEIAHVAGCTEHPRCGALLGVTDAWESLGMADSAPRWPSAGPVALLGASPSDVPVVLAPECRGRPNAAPGDPDLPRGEQHDQRTPLARRRRVREHAVHRDRRHWRARRHDRRVRAGDPPAATADRRRIAALPDRRPI